MAGTQYDRDALPFVLSGADYARSFGKSASMEVLERALELAYVPKYKASKTLIVQLEREIRKKKKVMAEERKMKRFYEE